jgi:gliding motility-associated-like protein
VADMKFIGTGSVPCCGMLIDDIQIFECPGDNELPVVNNPPEDFEVECESDAPAPPTLIVSDNCDSNPKITLKEKKETLDPCTKKITRTWEIKDACGNVTMEDQIIDIIDKTKPVFTKVPENEFVNCTDDVVKAFNAWIKKNGNAIAKDNCTAVSWRTNYERLPKNHCDTILTEFFITDVCGNENTGYAFFVVLDSVAPKFLIKPQSKNLVCVPNVKDSLREWLINFGYSKTNTDCDTVFLSHNFNGDSTKSPVAVTFYARDYCGNVDSSMAVFSFRSASDTFHITNYSCSFSGNSMDTIPYTNNGCDSIVILEKIKLNPDSIYLKMNTCNPLQKPFDTLALFNVNGCDSLVFLEHILQPTPVTFMQFMDCNFSAYSKDTLQFTGQYCDSFLIREFIPLRKDSISLQQSTCDKSQEGIAVVSLKNSFGCDSIVTINTIYTGVQNTFLTSLECGLLKNYTDTVIKSNGNCDSLFITTHIGIPIDTVVIQSSSCDKTKVGTFSLSLKNQYGCDSLVIETISLNPSDSIFILKSTCIISQAGVNIQVLKNNFGCDSIITTNTQFIPSDTSTITQTTCDISKVQRDTLIRPGQPCDSIVFVNTIFVPSDTIMISKTSCDPLKVGFDTMIVNGPICDSVFIINTAFLRSDTIGIIQKTCNPLDAGFRIYNYQNANGCDSLVLVTTNYIPLRLKYELDSISCFNFNDGKFKVANTGDFSNTFELVVNNNKLGTQTELNNLTPGNYEIFIQDMNGCVTDSIQFNLTNPSALIIDLGNDYFVNKGTLIQLNLQSNKTLTNIFWSPSTITTCSNCAQVQFTADQEGWIYAFAVDDRGCQNRDSIYIRLKTESRIFAPTAISNNGDNINDNFFLIGDEKVIIELMEIYDRWGELLFSTSNIAPNHPELGWNGIFKNEKMNPGVYVYYAKIRQPSGESQILKGDFTLIR